LEIQYRIKYFKNLSKIKRKFPEEKQKNSKKTRRFFLTFLCPKLIFVEREFSRAFLYACLSQGGHIKGAKLL
jgi:hypothetical protein